MKGRIPMKSGVRVLNNDTGFRNMKKELVKRYGKNIAESIWQKAGANLEELSTRYAELPKKIKIHTEGNMFRNAALYMAIKMEYPDEAMEILENGAKAEGLRIAKLFSAISKDIVIEQKGEDTLSCNNITVSENAVLSLVMGK